MSNYVLPDPSVAEWWYKMRKEGEELARRLQDASPEQRKHLVRSTSEQARVRCHVLSSLMPRWDGQAYRPHDPELPDIVLELMYVQNTLNAWTSCANRGA
jgi:hypothetical protein